MLGRRLYEVLRPGRSEVNEDGYIVQGESSTFNVLASIQPLTTDEKSQYVQPNADGEYTRNAVKIYTTEWLNVSKQADIDSDGVDSDFIMFEGNPYKLVMRASWQSGLINHYKYVAVEVAMEDVKRT